jgi:putative spermidine/putrescine transport system substrate-binding protein
MHDESARRDHRGRLQRQHHTLAQHGPVARREGGPFGQRDAKAVAEPPAGRRKPLRFDRACQEGVRLAFRKLDTIRDDIVWWQDPAEPAEMLADGTAVMAAGFNGRFFDEAQRDRTPIDIVWDGRIIGIEVWAIPATTDAPYAARAFVVHASEPASMARLATHILYGPARQSAFDRIGINPDTGVPMRAYLPNAPQHDGRALVRDSTWYANTEELRQRRFRDWLDAAD